MERHYLDYFESSVVNYWDYPALSDYKTDINLTFGELAIQIEKLLLMFKEAGIQKGDKIALCGRNISHWAVGFLAVTTYEAVAVSIMDAFTPESVHHLVNHSDARMFLVGDLVWPNLDIKEMPALEVLAVVHPSGQLVEVVSGGNQVGVIGTAHPCPIPIFLIARNEREV